MPAQNLYKPKEKEKSIYSSPGTANSSRTAEANTRRTPQNNVWSTEQSTPHSQSVPRSNAVPKPKREKTPSEPGEEVVRIMLEDFAQEQRQKLAAEDRAAQYGSAAAGTKATAGEQKTAQYINAVGQFGGQASYSSLSAAKPAVRSQKAAPYGGAAAATYSSPAEVKPVTPKREKTPSELGDEVVARVLVDEGLMDPKELEEYLASFEEPSAQTFTNAGGSDLMGRGANAARNAAPGDGLSAGTGNAGEDAGPTQAIPDWLELMAMSDPDHPGLTAFANQAGPWLWDKAVQLVEDTHIAEGLSVPLYWIDRGVNAGERFFEGIWNYGVDSVEAGADFALEQQKQQAQQWAPLGGLYQNHADFVSDNVQIAQEKLPELAEYFRRHEAAKHLQEIEDMYDAGGLIKIGGDTASGLVQIGAAGTIGALTGGGGGLIALGASAAGNAADEARAGGADDKTAYMYGNLVGLVEVGTELLSGGIPGLPKGFLDNALANVAETNMGRLAMKAVQDALGEGAEEFIGTMAEAYLAKLWNGDERGAWQTFKETFPDALYAAFQGAMTSTIMNAPGNISNIQYARALDAAIDVLNNGGTVTEAESAAANAALQYLTGSWGEDSKWSKNAIRQWDSARNRRFDAFFPPIPGDMTQSNTAQNNAMEDSVPTDGANSNAEQNTNLQTEDRAENESLQEMPKFSTEKTYIDDDPATHTEEQMRRIEEYKQAVDPEIIDFIELVRESPANNKSNLSLGRVASQQAQRIMELTGIDVTDFTHIMRSDTIRHIDKRHGVFGEANHSMANNEDIARIRYVIENADSIDLVYDKNGKQVFSWEIRNSDNTPAALIQYTKALDGVCYVIQAVADSKAKKLRIVSAYIGPKQSVPPDEASA